MPAVDRNVLRMGVWEVLWCEDVPDPVAITEAVGLVRELSTDESRHGIRAVVHTLRQQMQKPP